MTLKRIIQAVNELNDVTGVPQGNIKKKISWGALYIYVLMAICGLFIYLYINAKNESITKEQYDSIVKEKTYYRNLYDSLMRDDYNKTSIYTKNLEDKIFKLDSMNTILRSLDYKQKYNSQIFDKTKKVLKNVTK